MTGTRPLAVAFALPGASNEARQSVLGAFEQLPAQPDAAPALSRLATAGVRIVALTNGGTAKATTLLADAGLDLHVEVPPRADAGPARQEPEHQPDPSDADNVVGPVRTVS